VLTWAVFLARSKAVGGGPDASAARRAETAGVGGRHTRSVCLNWATRSGPRRNHGAIDGAGFASHESPVRSHESPLFHSAFPARPSSPRSPPSPLIRYHLPAATRDSQTSRNARNSLKTNDGHTFYPRQFPSHNSPRPCRHFWPSPAHVTASLLYSAEIKSPSGENASE
jgi:hypothetical protein